MKAELNILESQRSLPSVTIILSTELNSFGDKESIAIRLKESVLNAKMEMLEKFDKDTVATIISKLNELIEQIDYRHLKKGVGLFASRKFSKKLDFPFSVNNRSFVTEGFITSDIRNNLAMLLDYEVLVLSRKESKLFSGIGQELEEINDDFPIPFSNDFQVSRADTHSFYNKEETKIDDARRSSYFRNIAQILNQRDVSIPLVLIGTIENRSDFKNTKKCKRTILAEINGNMDKLSTSEISKRVWSVIEPIAKRQANDLYTLK